MASTEMEEIEIEAPDHSKTSLNSDCETEIGRASHAFGSGDRTISRRHVLLKPPSAAAENPTAEPRACFEVTGKNPVWVRRGKQGKIEIFRGSERGELACGDAICLSGKSPAWFLVKRSGDNSDRDSVNEEDGNKSSIDLESIDPVKEFGFVVAGHEFDEYPKQRILNVTNWKWFLEESGEESCDSEDGARSGRRRRSRKRRKSAEKEGSDDEDWTGESEEDREVMVRAKKTGKPAYTTRSRDSKRTVGGKPKGGSSVAKISVEEESGDEDDDTLGGFIVEDDDDDNVAELEEKEEDEEDEEEFDDEEEDE